MTMASATILFACTHNMIRSPMAEALMKARFPNRVFVDSCGITEGSLDGFVVTVMDEIGIDLKAHQPKRFADLDDEYFDLIICFSEDSHKHATEFARGKSTEVEYWPVYDAALASENREERLKAYRAVRDEIAARLDARFGAS
ncbi:MAG: low molecular weight phosphatase family protein [Candidatus Puniceispirillales bacterium]